MAVNNSSNREAVETITGLVLKELARMPQSQQAEILKRGRGRPRKNPIEIPSQEKRGRGRPRKIREMEFKGKVIPVIAKQPLIHFNGKSGKFSTGIIETQDGETKLYQSRMASGGDEEIFKILGIKNIDKAKEILAEAANLIKEGGDKIKSFHEKIQDDVRNSVVVARYTEKDGEGFVELARISNYNTDKEVVRESIPISTINNPAPLLKAENTLQAA